MEIKPVRDMWIVVRTRDENPWLDTIRYHKRASIEAFVGDSEKNWAFWRRRHGFKCVKVDISFTVKTSNK